MPSEILVCGLGVEPSQDATLETLQALGGCDVVLTDLRSKASADWLRPYCKELKSVASAEDVLKASEKKSVGLAVWGHPLFSSELARELIRRARASERPFRMLGAISPVGSVFARQVQFLGGDYGYQGIQAFELRTLLRLASAWTPELPLVLFAEDGSPEDWKKAAALIAAGYPAAHAGVLHELGAGERSLTLAELAREGARGAVLFVPPVAPPLRGESQSA